MKKYTRDSETHSEKKEHMFKGLSEGEETGNKAEAITV